MISDATTAARIVAAAGELFIEQGYGATSVQDVAFAPKSLPVTCINWDLTYLLTDHDGTLVLSGIDPSAQSMTACQ